MARHCAKSGFRAVLEELRRSALAVRLIQIGDCRGLQLYMGLVAHRKQVDSRV